MTKEEFEKRMDAIFDTMPGNPTTKAIDHLWADIEAERGVVVDWSKAPQWATHIDCHWSAVEGDRCFLTIPRPAPKYRPMTQDEKIKEIIKKYGENGMWWLLKPETLDEICKAAGVETRVMV